MAISTLFIVNQSTVSSDSSGRIKILATIGIWLFPVISSSIITGLQGFGPVSGNWCWVVDGRNGLRYGLGHGIRFAIIIATIIIYGIVFYTVRSKLATTLQSSHQLFDTATNTHVAAIQGGREDNFVVEHDIEMANLINKSTMVTISVDQSPIKTEKGYLGAGGSLPTVSKSNSQDGRKIRVQNRQNVARIMLMRAYPFSYVILWLPGIANRLAELAGHPMQFLVILQASTQYIGLVDSILYIVQWKVLKRD